MQACPKGRAPNMLRGAAALKLLRVYGRLRAVRQGLIKACPEDAKLLQKAEGCLLEFHALGSGHVSENGP